VKGRTRNVLQLNKIDSELAQKRIKRSVYVRNNPLSDQRVTSPD